MWIVLQAPGRVDRVPGDRILFDEMTSIAMTSKWFYEKEAQSNVDRVAGPRLCGSCSWLSYFI